ncbi:MAG: type II toxin-antitoxin system VapC family toxin [Candidatus Bathyarchaeia archaeon]
MRLFDTAFLVDLVNADAGAARLAKKIDEEASPSFISVITLHEYLFGIYFRYEKDKTLLKEKLDSAERDLSRFEPVPLTPEITRLSACMHAELTRSGKLIGINDMYIAATAIRYDLTLVTRNKAHFRRIPKLNIEIY